MNIKLFCAVGMSTSMLVTKMKEVAKKRNLDYEIAAYSIESFENEISSADVVLFGPQVGYALESFQSRAQGKPIAVIPMIDYGMMNGEKILDFAIKLKEEGDK